MKVDIWSDVVCPWCYIGKRRFESALDKFEHNDQVEIEWHSFELDPSSPSSSEKSLSEMLASKYGMSLEEARAANTRVSTLAAAEGLDYHLDQAHPSNTFDAHRLIHLAATHGLQGEMKERLLKAYFTEGQPIGDHETLAKLAGEVGVDIDEARDMLASDAYAKDVKADERQARTFGITGVPFFVIDEKYGISGAQPTEVFEKALDQVWAESHPLLKISTTSDEAGSCDGDTCTV